LTEKAFYVKLNRNKSKEKKVKIGIIGCGNMGQALLRGLIIKKYASKGNIFCFDKDKKKLRSLRLKFGINTLSSNAEVVQKCAVIILAVKPQDLGKLIKGLSCSFQGKLVISVCAGISTKMIESYLGGVSVVRVMPNMPAQISQGISVITLGKYAKANDKRHAKAMFSCIGDVVEVKEHLMDAVTAISGSGPAYFFYLVENLIKTAKRLGLSTKVAQKLAIKTALGSAMLLDSSSEGARLLRGRVTSRGGTTEAAFDVFKKAHLENILGKGISAAAGRARQLRK